MMFHENVLLLELEKMMESTNLREEDKVSLCHALLKSKKEEVNILLVGATGSGKSSTINAIFGKEIAKVGVGVDPETMWIEKHTMPGLLLWDSPGLGDGIETDARFRNFIVKKLAEKKDNGEYLIDLVLVVMEGGTRDLGTTYDIVNKLIIPCLGEKPENHILIGINQCDFAMKGRHWNFDSNTPDDTLLEFLEEKVSSIQSRVKEATGIQTSPFYYSAGLKEEGQAQNPPYRLEKLLLPMIHYCPSKTKRVVSTPVTVAESGRISASDTVPVELTPAPVPPVMTQHELDLDWFRWKCKNPQVNGLTLNPSLESIISKRILECDGDSFVSMYGGNGPCTAEAWVYDNVPYSSAYAGKYFVVMTVTVNGKNETVSREIDNTKSIRSLIILVNLMLSHHDEVKADSCSAVTINVDLRDDSSGRISASDTAAGDVVPGVVANAINSVRNNFPGGGGGCYVTTAICSVEGKADDCYELTMLREFRDKWLQFQEGGTELIQQYYQTAPSLVEKIDLQENPGEIYQHLREHYLNPCLDFLERGQKQECKERYSDMMTYLYQAETTFSKK